MFLEKLQSVKDLKKLKLHDLENLSQEIRDYIIDIVSKNGGHLASSLGVVELTIALHYVFNTPKDKIIWDVGHQCYAHKILTGRREEFKTLRQYKGISGFPKIKESKFDSYDVGHSSTSLSLALGEAVSRDLKNKNNKVLAVIGDGSLTGGMALEALNHIGHLNHDLIIILNDNEHSISKNVGAISEYLTRIISGSLYNKIRRKSMKFIKKIPKIGTSLFNMLTRFTDSFKGILVPGQFFQDMGLRYFGPVDGNNIAMLIEILENVKQINSGPKIIHMITKKGKGYLPAEKSPAKFHGIGPFDKATGISLKKEGISYSEIAGKTLAHLSKKDHKIIAITAAMKLGTGLYEFEKESPERFYDVGIAEQHAITFAGALASGGMKPFVSIYSTFIQRAIDQIIHDIAIMNLPVKILIDRSGIVGPDGETHHGLFDIALLRNIPNFIILAPSSGEELRDMICFAADYSKGPIAIRYPRGHLSEELEVTKHAQFKIGKIKIVRGGADLAIFTLGDMVQTAHKISAKLETEGLQTSVINLRSIKPLDISGIEKIITSTKSFITLENGIISGGVGEYILSNIQRKLAVKLLFCAGFPDEFIPHGSNSELFQKYNLDVDNLTKKILHAYRKNSIV